MDDAIALSGLKVGAAGGALAGDLGGMGGAVGAADGMDRDAMRNLGKLEDAKMKAAVSEGEAGLGMLVQVAGLRGEPEP